MTTIGTAVLQIIPSLDGVSSSIDKQLGGTLTASGKKGGKALAKGLGDGLKDLEQQLDSAGKAYMKLRDKASDALGKVRSDEAALQRLRDTNASDDRVIRAEERLATSRRNSSRATREAQDSYKSVQAAQSALADNTDNLGRKFGGLSDFAGTAGRALGAAGVIAGGAALAGVAALGAGLAIAGRELYDLGAKFDDVFDNLRLKTGSTGPALAELENATKRISTTVPASISDIGDVVAETSRAFKGLNGADFDNLVSHVANLNRLTGENVNVRDLGKAYRLMGVDLKDQVPTLDAFFRASESSGIGVNELIGVVNRGGAQLKQFGLDMASSAALVTSFETAGVDASKVIPGLNTALKGFAKAGTDPRKGLEDTITQVKALADAGNETGALDLANKVFGAKGGAAFAEVIQSGNLDIQTLNDTLSTTGDTIDQASQDTDDWAETWQTFKNKVEVAVQPLASGVFDAVNGQLEGLADWVTAHQPEIIGFFTQVGLAAVSMAEFVIKSTGMFAQGLGELIAPIGDVIGGILKVGAWMQRLGGHDDVAAEWDKQSQSMFGLGENLYAFGEKAKNVSLSGLYDDIKKTGERAQEAAKFTGALGDATASLPDGKTITITDNSPETIANLRAIGVEIVQTPTGLTVTAKTEEAKRILDAFRAQQTGAPITPPVKPDLGPANTAMQGFFDQWSKAVVSPQVLPQNAPGSSSTGGQPNNPLDVMAGGGRAAGGPIFGAGTATSDSIPAWLSNGEHVWTAKEVDRAGGHGAMYRMRDAVLNGYAGGGGIKTAQIPWPPAPIGPTGSGEGNVPDPSPGRYPGRIAVPDWSVPGQGWGPPPADWWGKPVNPDDVLFPDEVDPGKRQQQKEIWERLHPRIKPLGFSDGGPVGPDVLAAGALVGTAYSQANRTDCSGMVARVIDRTLGMPETGLMSTKNAEEWLKARGFKPGIGGKGQLSVGWYDHGPNPNDGHMAMTLSDGSNAEAGGGVGDIFQIGGGAAGASNPEFDQHMFLPTMYGEGPAGSSSASPFASGSAVAAMTGGATPAAAPSSGGGGGGGGSSGGSASISLPSAFSGLAGIGLDGLGIKTKVGPDSPERTLDLGGVAASAVGGQISSALDVFGIGDSPPFLQAASKLISGIGIGGKSSSAAPLSATSTATGVPPDAAGNVHGTRAGQQPGPTVNYNITARDTEDSFVKANRIEREKSAAKLSRF